MLVSDHGRRIRMNKFHTLPIAQFLCQCQEFFLDFEEVRRITCPLELGAKDGVWVNTEVWSAKRSPLEWRALRYIRNEFVARMLCIVGLIVLPIAYLVLDTGQDIGCKDRSILTKRMVSPSILIAISRYACS